MAELISKREREERKREIVGEEKHKTQKEIRRGWRWGSVLMSILTGASGLVRPREHDNHVTCYQMVM